MIKSIAQASSGMIAGSVSVALFLLLRMLPLVAESLYGKGIYPIIRHVLDYSFGLFPFPVVYLFPVLLLFIILWPFFHRKGWKNHLLYYLNFCGFMIAGFYLLWGYNYARPTLSDRLQQPVNNIVNRELESFGESLVAELNAIRTTTLFTTFDQSNLESQLRGSVEQHLMNYGYMLNTSCRARLMQPPGVLRKFGISGIYFPFTGEALLEKQHPVPEQIFVMAHEFAHSYGVTDEGEANLIAYLACTSHPNEMIQYAGKLSMWEYLKTSFRRRKMETALSLKDQLSPLVQADLEMLRKERRKYREWVPNLSDAVNDTYLKAQGIEDGTDAYLSLPELYLQHNINRVK